jgi:multidrug efflux pump subunit AcrB
MTSLTAGHAWQRRYAHWILARARAVGVVWLAVIVLGCMCAANLPVASLPRMDVAQFDIETTLPGANAQTMAATVTGPIERQMRLIPGVASVRSESYAGESDITVTFAGDKSLLLALQQVQAAVNLAAGDLPANLPQPPAVTQGAGPDSTVITLAVSSPSMTGEDVSAFVETVLGPAIARADGVGALTYHGLRRPAVRVDVDARHLSALGLVADDVRQALVSANGTGPQGRVDAGHVTRQIASNAPLLTSSDVASVVVASQSGAAIHVGDVATVYDGAERDRDIAWLGEHRAVMVDVEKSVGANVLRTVQAVRERVAELKAGGMPVEVEFLADTTHVVDSTIHELELAFLISVVLVFIVVLAFVRSVPVALIPCISIPLSICPVFVCMVLAGYSIDVISLLALILAVGFVVDDAILVTERIMDLAGSGMSADEAASEGLAEVFGSVWTMTASLFIVVAPLFAFPGMLGELMREFGVVSAVAVIASAFAALTFIPVACRVALSARRVRAPAAVAPLREGVLARFFNTSIMWTLRHPLLMLLFIAGGSLYAWHVGGTLETSLVPPQDNGQIVGYIDASPTTSFEAMVPLMRQVMARVGRVSGVRRVFGAVQTDPYVGFGRIFIDAGDPSTRATDVRGVIDSIQTALDDIPGIEASLKPRQDIDISLSRSKGELVYEMVGADAGQVRAAASQLVDTLRANPVFRSVSTSNPPQAADRVVTFDRERMGRLGVTMSDANNALYDAFGDRQVTTMFRQADQRRLILSVHDTVLGVDPLMVRSVEGTLVDMRTFARFTTAQSPVILTHTDGLPAEAIDVSLTPGVSMSQGEREIAATMRGTKVPEGIHLRPAGTAEQFALFSGSKAWILAVALGFIYVILVLSYNSFTTPAAVLLSLPCAVLGAALMLRATSGEMTLISFIGLILLIGIVKKNGILVVGDASARQHPSGRDLEATALAAVRRRSKPMLMTTLVAVFGAIPLVVGSGYGAELRRPLGVIIIGGLLFAQLTSLYVVPSVWVMSERMRRRGWMHLFPPAG